MRSFQGVKDISTQIYVLFLNADNDAEELARFTLTEGLVYGAETNVLLLCPVPQQDISLCGRRRDFVL
jgi:hypothetical protein